MLVMHMKTALRDVFIHSIIIVYLMITWSRLSDSNRGPTLYKSVALTN